jgi:cytochrome c-type protein NapB
MSKVIKLAALSALVVAPALYAASVAACTACHGQQFETAAMGKSKIVKNMSKEEIVAAMKGYKDGSYGGAMKGIMKGQVASLDDAAIEGIAAIIVGGGSVATEKATEHAAAAAVAETKIIDINKKACDPDRIKKEDLGSKKKMTEESLGLRKTNLYAEEVSTVGSKGDFARPAAGTSTRFERAFVNAPPMIPHDVEGMTEITKENNQCIGCHMPEVAPSVKATPIPKSHFTNFRPDLAIAKDGKVIMEGKQIDNTSDVKTVAHTTDGLYQGRFNCTACHAPQAKIDTVVANTFTPDFKGDSGKTSSSLVDVINEGVE